MGKCVYYTYLDKIVAEKENISMPSERDKVTSARDKWSVIDYETGDFCGRMLMAGQETDPKPVTLKPGLKGYFKIFLGFIGINGEMATGISLNGGNNKDIIDFIQDLFHPEQHWASYSFARECFYKVADFTQNDSIIVYKPREGITSALAFIKAEEISFSEYSEYKKTDFGHVNFHMDNDFVREQDYRTPEEYAARINMFEGAGGGKIFYETSFDECLPKPDKNAAYYLKSIHAIEEPMSLYLSNLSENTSSIISTAKKLGYEVYSTYRMEAGDFIMPYACYAHNEGFDEKYPGMCCETRDGRKTSVLSYAYEDVREMMVEKLVRVSSLYDGVSLIFHRGTHVAFDKPVIDEVYKRYGLDARKLLHSDYRLNSVLCEFMTLFMRRLRAALDIRKKINVIVYYDPVTSKNFGLDVETWAREKLIDSVSQGLMNHYEDIDSCLDNDGYVDLGKYKEYIKYYQPVKRNYCDDDFKLITEGSAEFLKICDKYGIEYYGSLSWEHMQPEDDIALAKAQKKVGVKKFLSWDGNHKAKRLPILNAEKFISREFERLEKIEPPEFVKFRRVLSLDGKDISAVNPSWRG